MRITKEQFAGVDQYKYSGVDKSVVSKHVLGPFWTWLVTLFPMKVAPNTVSSNQRPATPKGELLPPSSRHAAFRLPQQDSGLRGSLLSRLLLDVHL